jgi:CelD/BcsL family acetyltransferase involved in cellulose biosynthesis
MLAPAKGLVIERQPLAALAHAVVPWRQLAARACEPNVFYEPAFALAAAPTQGRNVEAFLVWSSGTPRRLLGLFPVRHTTRRYGVKVPVLVGWTHPFGPLGTPLVDRDAAGAVTAALLDHVAADAAGSKLLLLPLLPEAGPVAQALRAAAAARGGAHAAHARHRRAALTPGADDPRGLAQTIGTKRFREYNRLHRRLAETGRIDFHLARTPDDIAPALHRFLALEAQGWKGAAGTALIGSPALHRFAETAVDALARQGGAMIAELKRDGQTIAAVVALQSGGSAWTWKIAYDEQLARFSPGLQAMTALTAALLADPAVCFVDSCAIPDHPMIDHLWHDRIAIADLMIGATRDAQFTRACRMESARNDLIALARRVRDRLRRKR